MYFNEWITGVQHVAVPTNDLEKTIEFYHSLGFTTALKPTMRPPNTELFSFSLVT